MKTVLRHMNQKTRELELTQTEQDFHPVIERAARAISDWHSERDWIYQTDRAKRVIDALADELNKEGHKEASSYLQRLLTNNQLLPRVPEPCTISNPLEKDGFSTLYF
jgi:hypothetical protein